MRKYAGFAILVCVAIAVDHLYGPIGYTRLFGVLFLLSAIWGIWTPRLEVRLGQHPVGSLSGWMKAFVLLPAAALGLAMLVYAPEITCFGSRYRHLCS
jgi:hypothetical protein